MNTFGGCGGVSCSVFMLDLQDVLLGSASGPKQDAQGGIIETGQAGNNGQPVEEAEVPTHDQDHLGRKRLTLDDFINYQYVLKYNCKPAKL